MNIVNLKDKIELSETFINLCNDLLSSTGQTDDEIFMVKSFLNLNENIIEWSLSKCSEKNKECYNNFKYNYINN